MSDRSTSSYRTIHLHEVNGDIVALEFLHNADMHFVEGLFFFAKRYGRADFSYKGRDYEIIKNRNLTYTVRRRIDDDERMANVFE